MANIAQVIKYEGDNSTFIWKHPCEDFNTTSQLIVHESQEAIFFMNGQALDLFGPGRVDVTTWSNGNLDIVSTNTFATSAGYFLYAKDSEQRFDTQIYNIISVTGGDGTATVKAQAVSVDNITDNAVYDLATIVENTDEAGNVTQSYKLLEGAYIENFDYGADFATNMSNMAVNTDYLGVMEFVFGINGISIYLDHINMP